jgi:glucose/mannose-6-phosphate isomerase
VTDLDDQAALGAADPGGMLDAIASLPEQCRAGYVAARSSPGLPSANGVSAVAFCGMGGSAIAGDLIAAWLADRLPVPVAIVRRPELPGWCGPDTLVIASSYSGDTSETASLFESAVARGCRVVAIASGGELARRADELGVAWVRLPGGFAMPRAAIGHLAMAPVGALVAMGLVADVGTEVQEAADALDGVLARCGPAAPASANPAKALARWVGERALVVWGADGIGSVAAARWKAAWNENAKVPAFWSALPELDHNEVVGWSESRGGPFALVALRHDGEHPDVAARFPLSLDIARSSGVDVEEVWATGSSDLSCLLELVLIGDLASTYAAIARGIDPTPIEAIARLKRALAGAP